MTLRHSFKVLLAAPHPALVDLDAKPGAIGHRDVTVGDAKRLDDDVLKRLDDLFPGYKTAPEHYAW